MLGVRILYSVVLSITLFVCAVSAQTTEFNYQGSLKDGASPATGNYDFEFKLFDAVSGGTQQGSTQQKLNVAVANGIFSASLDFGAGTLPGADRFLDISVRTAGGGAFTALTPRQKVNSAPYSVKSLNSTAADVAANATQLGGVAASQYVVTTDPRMTDSRNPLPGSGSYIQNTTSPQSSSNFNISGNGTASGTLSGNVINATTQYNIGGSRVVSVAGTSNVFAGIQAGQLNTTGFSNSFFGKLAGQLNNGSNNSFFGSQAGSSNTSGGLNSFFGSAAGFQTTGDANSFFGSDAGFSNTTGNYNSFFGWNAGDSNQTGSGNTIVGTLANVGSSGLTNAAAIGANAFVAQNNSLILGAIKGVNLCFPPGCDNVKVGIGTTAPDTSVQVVDSDSESGTIRLGNNSVWNAGEARRVFFGDGTFVYVGEEDADDRLVLYGRLGIRFKANLGQMVGPDLDNQLSIGGASNRWTAVYAVNGTIQTSDARLKKGITGLNYGLSQVMRLKPVSFKWKDDSDNQTHLGLLAQDVEKIIPEAVVKNSDPSLPLGMNYSTLVPVLVKAIQEQQVRIDAQNNEVAEQKATNQKLQSQLDALKKLVCEQNAAAQVCSEK